MPKRWFILAISALGILAALITVLSRKNQPADPIYRGLPLSSYLLKLRPLRQGSVLRAHAFNTANPQASLDARLALREIGTNAIPPLISWIQYDPAPWKRGLFSRIRRASQRFNVGPIQWDEDRETLAEAAGAAFMVLGREAEPAIPQTRPDYERHRQSDGRI